MERVELLTELQHEFGVRVPDEQMHRIFTLGQLVARFDRGRRVSRDRRNPGAPPGEVTPGVRTPPSSLSIVRGPSR